MKTELPLCWDYNLVRWVVLRTLKLWVRFEIFGAEHIPTTGPFVVAANHASYLDPPIVGVGVRPRAVTFLARESLFRFAPFGWWLRRLHALPIDRRRGDTAALRAALRLLRQGHAMALFPEGTRSPDGSLQPPKPGVGFLMARSGAPVLPAAIHGSYQALPKGAFWVRPARVTLRFGAPLDVAALWNVARQEPAPYEAVSRAVMARIHALLKVASE